MWGRKPRLPAPHRVLKRLVTATICDVYTVRMSTNRDVANLSIAVVKTLVKMAGFGRVADMIEGGQECLNLLADIKNDALGNPNAEMIRSLKGSVRSELNAIQDALEQDGLNKKQSKQALAQLSEAAHETIKNLGEDDDALIRAVQQPQCFAEQLRGHAAPLPDYSSDGMQAHYETLLDRIAEEFLTLAPWSPNFDRVALTELLHCFPALTDQIARVEHEIQEVRDKVDAESERSREADTDTHRKLDDLKDMVGSFTPTERKPLRVAFGSRPDVVAGDRFVERNEHKQLKALITDPTRHRTVLWGMRGCGKTQLAASLAKQCGDANWDLVAWINAVSRESIQSDLVELAKRLKIDTSDQPAQDVIVRRCLDHLKSAAPTDRLIVFDNVEDINHLTGLIPSGDGVRVVATTTNKVGWEDQGWNSIEVGVFDRNTSIGYLLTVTNSNDHDTADALAKRLGDLPLAIAQAAATARHKDLSLAQYLKRLKSRGAELVIRPINGDEYTVDAVKALLMAVKDTIKGLEGNTKETAQRQLGALALLAESGVPTRWLDPTVEQLDDDESPDTQRDTDEDAHDALTELIHRSIVQQSADGTTIMLHRLQAQTLRESWSKNEYNEACAAAAYLLDHVDINRFRRNDTNARRKETLDLTNQLRAISVQEDSQNLLASPQIFRSLSRAFSHASDLGLPYEALTLDVAVEALEGLLGPDHPYTLASRNNLAGAYEGAGRLTEAIPLYEQVLADRIRVLGEYHPQTLTSRNNLACAFESAGRLTEAIPLYEQVLADRIRVLGEYHPQTLISRNNLGSAYMSASRPTDAITLFEQVVVGSIRTMGEDHPDTLMSLNNLAGAYESAGQTDKATVLYEKVLADSIRVLGEDHPHTLATRNNLAGTYISTKNFDDAIVLYKQVIADSIRVLGEDHPHTLATRNNLVYAYASAGQLTEAIMLNERVISDQIRVLGAEHPHTLISRINLAGTLETVGRIDEAITQFKQILTDCIRILGDNHPSTLTACKNFAHALHTAGRTDEAIIYFEQFVIDSTEILGDDHPSTLIARNNLASLYYAAGRTDEATPLFEQLLTDNIRILGDDHPLTTTVRENLEAARRELEQQEEDSANEEREQED